MCSLCAKYEQLIEAQKAVIQAQDRVLDSQRNSARIALEFLAHHENDLAIVRKLLTVLMKSESDQSLVH